MSRAAEGEVQMVRHRDLLERWTQRRRRSLRDRRMLQSHPVMEVRHREIRYTLMRHRLRRGLVMTSHWRMISSLGLSITSLLPLGRQFGTPPSWEYPLIQSGSDSGPMKPGSQHPPHPSTALVIRPIPQRPHRQR
ncbi:hypothetical protein PIB30_065450 [Stylosanthes scabra]|uniref:Uncharacterized protein n=1 Tax=Stylosanthes scabra TaxID=79078 RepID=A0ABU6WKE0_9FABA|nr:hypothetical protein [Stylosanthes scabra]